MWQSASKGKHLIYGARFLLCWLPPKPPFTETLRGRHLLCTCIPVHLSQSDSLYNFYYVALSTFLTAHCNMTTWWDCFLYFFFLFRSSLDLHLYYLKLPIRIITIHSITELYCFFHQMLCPAGGQGASTIIL